MSEIKIPRQSDCDDPECKDDVICDDCVRAHFGDAFVDEMAGSGNFVDQVQADGSVMRKLVQH